MPYSSEEGKQWIKEKLLSIASQNMNILDVGAGSGTYSVNYKTMLGGYWEAVEVFPRYIEQFKLNDKYDFIHIQDIRNFDWKIKDYDVVFFGDILEHVCKEDAQRIVEKAVIHSKYVFISIPIIKYPQDEYEGNPYERHVKDDWTHKEVKKSFNNIIDFERNKTIGTYLLSNKI